MQTVGHRKLLRAINYPKNGIRLARVIYSETVSLPPQLSGGVENGADDLVVAGAPAKVAGKPVARLGFRRIRIAVQQGLGRDQHAWRTEAALERRMLEEFPTAFKSIHRKPPVMKKKDVPAKKSGLMGRYFRQP